MPKIEKVVFFGTPEFAIPTLAALCEAGRPPILVVSQPDRPAGRGQKESAPPVAAWAREHGLELMQPESVRDPEFMAHLTELAPDLGLVVAFGQIFPAELLSLPKRGCVNLHASLLPKYRGASPIQGAIANGDNRTGVTTMVMEEELDAGPILMHQDTPIEPRETAGSLEVRLAALGAKLVLDTLAELDKKKPKPRKQAHDSATYAPRIEKSDGKINWALEAKDIYNRMRAHNPWPGTTAIFRGKEIKIVRAKPIDWELAPSGSVGTYLGLRQGRMAILCGNSTMLGIEGIQRPGKKPVRPADFVNGERLRVGDRLA